MPAPVKPAPAKPAGVAQAAPAKAPAPAPEKPKVTQLTVVYNTIQQSHVQDEYKAGLAVTGVSLAKFTAVAKYALATKPDLLRADRASLYRAITRCAQLGLLPDGKEAALVTYRTQEGNSWIEKVQAQPMVYGIVQLLGKAGISAYAATARAGESVRIWNDDAGQHIEHEIKPFSNEQMIGVYAAAKLPNGATFVEAMSIEQVEVIMSRTKSKDRNGNIIGPWKTDFERMAQKTPLKRIANRVPLEGPAAEALRRAIDTDNQDYLEPAQESATEAQPGDESPEEEEAPKSVGTPSAFAGMDLAEDAEFEDVPPTDDDATF